MFARSKSKKLQKPCDADVEHDSKPIDVLIDSIIGFLEHSTAYLRTVANQVFSLLSGAVQETTIDLILMVSIHAPLPLINCDLFISPSNSNTAIRRRMMRKSKLTMTTPKMKKMLKKSKIRLAKTKKMVNPMRRVSKNSAERSRKLSKSMV
jgi:hypothetical protein